MSHGWLRFGRQRLDLREPGARGKTASRFPVPGWHGREEVVFGVANASRPSRRRPPKTFVCLSCFASSAGGAARITSADCDRAPRLSACRLEKIIRAGLLSGGFLHDVQQPEQTSSLDREACMAASSELPGSPYGNDRASNPARIRLVEAASPVTFPAWTRPTFPRKKN